MEFHISLIPVIVFGKRQPNMHWTMACLTNTYKNWVDGLCKLSNCIFERLLHLFTVLIFASRLVVRQQSTHYLLLPSSSPKANSFSKHHSHPSHTIIWAQSSLLWPPEQRSLPICTGKLFSTWRQGYPRPRTLLRIAVPTKQSIIFRTVSHLHVTIAHRWVVLCKRRLCYNRGFWRFRCTFIPI